MKAGILLGLVLALCAGFVTGCAPKKKGPDQALTNTQKYKGELRNVGALMGGSPTGWELWVTTNAGSPPDVLSLDVSKVEPDARALAGKVVWVTFSARDKGVIVVDTIRQVGQ